MELELSQVLPPEFQAASSPARWWKSPLGAVHYGTAPRDGDVEVSAAEGNAAVAKTRADAVKMFSEVAEARRVEAAKREDALRRMAEALGIDPKDLG